MGLIFSKFKLATFLTLLLSISLFAGETGKIAGRITDSESGEPLAFANITIISQWTDGEEYPLANMLGSASDINGDYFIINISPGIYNVKVSYIGYYDEIRTKVSVSVDKTTNIDYMLKSEALTVVGDVVVTAFAIDKAERDLTATKSSYDLSKIEALPGVTDVGDILSLQADVSDGHFRGGRTGESQYLIGGSSINNPLNNSRAFDPMTIAFQQVEVYTSGFSAEYGNVQSGVINMVAKEGNLNKWQTRIDIASTNSYYKTWGGSV
ncbi:MAG: TonB-dependent receptor, partial [Melioribacteraceae bacterium]|nr:TonB-dependent receptor [Melioribacteraceae bacterium]